MKTITKIYPMVTPWGTGVFIPVSHELDIKKDAEYAVEIKKPFKKRTLDANAYFWVLCDSISRVLSRDAFVSKEDVYRDIVKTAGVFDDIAVQDKAVDSFCRVFEKNGVGWITENLGAAKNLKNCTKIRCYYGSSIYDGVQMSNLIACAVNEAENLGIETRTPEEVASLLKAWGEHETK